MAHTGTIGDPSGSAYYPCPKKACSQVINRNKPTIEMYTTRYLFGKKIAQGWGDIKRTCSQVGSTKGGNCC